jgi:hypothetical protein
MGKVSERTRDGGGKAGKAKSNCGGGELHVDIGV